MKRRKSKKKYYLSTDTFRRIKAMDFEHLNRWVESFYMSAYQAGIEATPGADVEACLEAIGKVRGIGPKRLKAIREALDGIK